MRSKMQGATYLHSKRCGSAGCWRAGGPAVFTAGYPYHPPGLDGMDMVFSACGAGAYDSSIELTACAHSTRPCMTLLIAPAWESQRA